MNLSYSLQRVLWGHSELDLWPPESSVHPRVHVDVWAKFEEVRPQERRTTLNNTAVVIGVILHHVCTGDNISLAEVQLKQIYNNETIDHLTSPLLLASSAYIFLAVRANSFTRLEEVKES